MIRSLAWRQEDPRAGFILPHGAGHLGGHVIHRQQLSPWAKGAGDHRPSGHGQAGPGRDQGQGRRSRRGAPIRLKGRQSGRT